MSWLKGRIWRPAPAYAHCDVPCGIYDPTPALIAAMSVTRFLDLLDELDNVGESSTSTQARFARLVAEKEAHATMVKNEVTVLWGDYFKPPHFEQHPELHELVHATLQEASRCKQETSTQHGRSLLALVNQIAEVFWTTKGVESRRVTAPYEPGLAMVQPVLTTVC